MVSVTGTDRAYTTRMDEVCSGPASACRARDPAISAAHSRMPPCVLPIGFAKSPEPGTVMITAPFSRRATAPSRAMVDCGPAESSRASGLPSGPDPVSSACGAGRKRSRVVAVAISAPELPVTVPWLSPPPGSRLTGQPRPVSTEPSAGTGAARSMDSSVLTGQ